MNHDPGRVAGIPPGRCLHNGRALTPAWALRQTIPLWFSPENIHQAETPPVGLRTGSSFHVDLTMAPGAEAHLDTRTEIATGALSQLGEPRSIGLAAALEVAEESFFSGTRC